MNPNAGEPPALRVDGSGRFAYERTLPSGLREQVICDGSTLWQLYPEIGLGAKRPMSRFHNATLQGEIPWLVPSVEELPQPANCHALVCWCNSSRISGKVGLVT